MRGKRDSSSYRRTSKRFRPKPFFIIVCEGKKTEPDYFKGFKYYGSGFQFVHSTVYIVPDAGQHEQVINKACEVYDKLQREYGTIKSKEVWCVFDCDGNYEALKKAIQLAKRKEFNAIYSIQCFELWFLLHFQQVTGPITDYDEKISKYLNINYNHGMTGMYEYLEKFQQTAIENAKRLWEDKKQMGNLQKDPITNVFVLVEALNEAYEKLKERMQ